MNHTTVTTQHPKVYEALASAFVAEGTEAVFALLGDGNMHWATAVAALGAKGYYTRHEHCACAMATMYGYKSGKVGVASVTCGPGLTQTMTALKTAVDASIPLVVFSGESPLGAAFYNQHIDQGPLVEATGTRYIAGHSPARMTDYVRDAFHHARTKRQPVVLGVPYDLQKQTLVKAYAYRPSSEFIPDPAPMPPNQADVARAVSVLSQGKRVVVIGGRGAMWSGAVPACERLADAVGGLLAQTLPVRGLFDHHPFGLGISGGYARAESMKLLREAEVVVAVGASLTYFTADSNRLFRDATIIQIDTQPTGIKHGRQVADIYVQADARLGVEAILAMLPKVPDPGWRSPEVAARIADPVADPTPFPPQPGLLDPRDAVSAIDAVIPKDWEIVNSSGHCAYFTAQLRGRKAENFAVIREFGAIGNGLSYAMGVAAAKPDQPIVLLDGDGSLMMHAQELETVRRHGLNILVCALNDGAYGSEIHKLRADGVSDAGAIHGRGDLAAMARGFGLRGVRIDSIEQFATAFAEFRAAPRGTVWDIHIADNVTTPVMRANLH